MAQVQQVQQQPLGGLRPVEVRNGKRGYEYYEDVRGGLWGARTGQPPQLLAERGKWSRPEAQAGVHVSAPPVEPPPAQVPTQRVVEITPTRQFTFTFQTVIGGIPGELSISAATSAEMLRAKKDVLKHGIQPLSPPEPFVVFPDGAAWCARHEALMMKRDKQGDSWWSHNCGSEGDPVWCKGRPGKDSPGWDP